MDSKVSNSNSIDPKLIANVINSLSKSLLLKIPGNPENILTLCLNKYDLSRIYNNYKLESAFNEKLLALRKMNSHGLADDLDGNIKKLKRCRESYFVQCIKAHFNIESLKDYQIQFCHHRLCPICNNKKSYDSVIKLLGKMFALEYNLDRRYAVYTFSPRNPNIEEFREFIDKLKQSPTKVFDRRCKELMDIVDGTIRCISIVFNGENLFHPHSHLLVHFKKPAISKLQGRQIYNILNEQFLYFMDLDEAQTCLTIYQSNLVNLVRTAAYLTKYGDHQNIADFIKYMNLREFTTYLDISRGLRESECTGIYRKDIQCQYSTDEIITIHKTYQYAPSQKLYEFKTTRKSIK